MNDVRILLKEAEQKIEIGELRAALWRVVDAAGLLSELVPKDSLGQQGYPTGLGNEIKKRQHS